jgi:CO dehydrogenase/acetyl-CoA synthase delta subunit
MRRGDTRTVRTTIQARRREVDTADGAPAVATLGYKVNTALFTERGRLTALESDVHWGMPIYMSSGLTIYKARRYPWCVVLERLISEVP